MVRVGIVQTETSSDETYETTLIKFTKFIKQAKLENLDLVGFPSLFFSKEYPLQVLSKEFDQIKTIVKEHGIVVVLGFAQEIESIIYESQVILDSNGDIALIRKKFHNLVVHENSLESGSTDDLVTTTRLKLSGLPVEIGTLLGDEHFDPRLTFNSATQHEKIHFALFSKNIDHADVNIPSLLKAYSIQTQTFSLVITPPNSTFSSMIISPDGNSHLFDQISQDFDGLKTFEFDLNGVFLIQKQFVDIVGHYSRPGLVSLQVHH